MKRYFKITIWLISSLLISSCMDHKRDSLDLSQDVTIHEFVINGSSGTIDNNNMTIHVVLPPKSDLTTLRPSIKVADNARVSPPSDETQNFSSIVEYKVVNGDVINSYNISVEVLNARITRFALNSKYNGVIDQNTNKISVTIPTSIDITKLTPTVEYTKGATISPSEEITQDFTHPITYALSYMNEQFTYEVTVTQSDHSYAFLGTGESVEGLTNMDEKAAAEWMLQNIPSSRYISLETLKEVGASLSQYTAVWFHYEQSNTLPTIAANRNVTNVIKDYYNNGGSLLLSGVASLYIGSLGITPSAYIPNNPFGSFANDPQVNAPGELWGISITGCENHPIYKELIVDRSSQSWPVVWLIGKDISWRRNIGCPWDLVAPYKNSWTDWSSKTGGTPLASFNWDNDCNEKVAISIFENHDNNKGTAICIGVPSYDWYYEKENNSSNSFYSNIEKMTLNIFEYMSNK